MPPKAKFTKEEVLDVALDIVKKEGIGGLTARSLASGLRASVCPIFTLFKSMDEVQEAVMARANALYESYLKEDMESGKYPTYKASGLGYIRFAKEQKELFKLLFMRDRSAEQIVEDRESIRPFIRLIQQNLGLDEEQACLFHLEMWLYGHGIATMIATSYLEWDMEFIGKALTDMYNGLKAVYGGKK